MCHAGVRHRRYARWPPARVTRLFFVHVIFRALRPSVSLPHGRRRLFVTAFCRLFATMTVAAFVYAAPLFSHAAATIRHERHMSITPPPPRHAFIAVAAAA